MANIERKADKGGLDPTEDEWEKLNDGDVDKIIIKDGRAKLTYE